MTYPIAPLGVRVRVASVWTPATAPTTWTWVDVTSNVRHLDPIDDFTGASDDASDTNTELSLVFKNDDARMTPGNAESDLYPFWDQGCPIEYALNVGDGAGYRVQCVVFADTIVLSWPSRTEYKCVATVHGGGLFSGKRLTAGLQSPLRRTTAGLARRRGLWPLEDGPGAVGGVAGPMVPFEGAGMFEFGQEAFVPGLAGVAKASAGQSMWSTLSVATTALGVRLSGMIYAPGAGSLGSPVEIMNMFTTWSDGTIGRYVLEMGSLGLRLRVYNAVSAEISAGGWIGFHQHELTPVWLDWDIVQSGTTITATVQETAWGIDAAGAAYVAAGGAGSWVYTGTLGRIGWVTLAPSKNVDAYYAMFALTEQPDFPTKGGLAAVMGWAGNTAAGRVSGMSTEFGIASSVVNSTYGIVMGPQLVDSVLANFRNCVAADHGVLSDQLGKVTYRAAEELWNLTPAISLSRSGARGQLGDIEPTRDDTAKVNRQTVSRAGGGSVTAEDTADITAKGLYEGEPQEINVGTDNLLTPAVGWFLARGVSEAPRYGRLNLRMRVAAEYTPALAGQVAALQMGDRITITSLPPQASPDPIVLQVRGRRQTVLNRGVKQWDVEYSAVPTDAYEAFVLDTDRLDTSGTEMIVAAGSADTTLMTATAGALPTVGATSVDLNAAGEKITLTNVVSEVITDAFARTVSNGWGSIPATTHVPAQAWSPNVAADVAVAAGVGTISVPTANTFRQCSVPTLTALDWDYTAFCTVPVLATGANLEVQVAWRSNGSTSYQARINIEPGGATRLVIYVPGNSTELVNIPLNITHSAGLTYGIRIAPIGALHRVKIWTGATQPSNFTLEFTDTTRLTPGYFTLRNGRANGNTNTSPVVFSWDNFTINNVQAFTVTRSVNTVVKAQPVGNRMRLWKSRGLGV